MGHLSLILIILAFGVGMAASSHAILLYNRFPIRYLKFHSALLILLNTVVFLGLLFNYIQINLMNQSFLNTNNIFYYSYYFVLSVLTAFILYVFIGLVFNLLKKNWPKKWKILYWIYFIGLILGQIVYLLMNPEPEGISQYTIFLLVIAVSFFLVSYVLVFLLFFQSKVFQTRVQRRLLQTLSLFLFLIFTTSLFLDASQIFKVVTLEEYLLYKSVVIYVLNLASLVQLKGFVKSIFPQETSPVGTDVFMEHLFQKYKLTQREQQVIRLICSGKSGKDIENELFLSPHTIKEYIYRIYKKTGVKNRVQMVNLFREQ
ncbi:MAG: helix-turn-helix transcriptional regulator [Candidatus Aminicenantes bacterium]|jgi:DNA-binding CsgD family transcriptional regulator|nr:helix-turn-helix transcriptional regulator [Candidatus Aminicenantes bacterium]MDH5384879.1 helix-turn-helix transcriptional regulator [Candidatus Aminicenantes bacterium]MDH5743187.1 helix-turn-helix transcriptional regulator [Candidatus Aminicenantes bacterium]